MIEAVARSSLNQRLAFAALVLALLAAMAGGPARLSRNAATKSLAKTVPGTAIDFIDAGTLAEWIMAKRSDFQVIDLRPEADFARYHIPQAVSLPHSSLAKSEWKGEGILIICTAGDELPREILDELKVLEAEKIVWLRGGIVAWADEVLFPDLDKMNISDEEIARRIERRSRYFGGEPTRSDRQTTPEKYLREGC